MDNNDNLTEAIHGLDIFTKNFCMNCAETDRTKDLVFNCSGCEFCHENQTCMIKLFVNNHSDHKYNMSNFGAMGKL